ncbi:hypothetical protein [Winogradskyella flava]|uniref:hypothetical protein n=1 Tax=Winogradskyella flava TaxID=1884876 RepID=UPI0024938757|nr:hypothetical protein [Winogradskyella flava]
MAIAIKSIPVLTEKAASNFEKRANDNTAKRASIDFSKERSIAEKILAKAKL